MYTSVCKQQLPQGAWVTCTLIDGQACGSCLKDVILEQPSVPPSSLWTVQILLLDCTGYTLKVLPARRLSLTLFQRASLVLMSALPSSVNQSRRSMPCRMSAF